MQRILRQHPDHARVHATYGWVAKNQNRYRIARHHFTESLRIDPESEWAQRGLRESLNNNLFWRCLEASDGIMVDSGWRILGFLYLYSFVYFGIWQGPWLDDKKAVSTNALDVVSHVIAAVVVIAFCLAQLIGRSLSSARLAVCARGRHLMQRNELTATLVAWFFVLCAAVMMSVGTIAMHRALYIAGCVVLWGAVPVTYIWKSRQIIVRGIFVIATIAYFGSAIACAAGFMQSPSDISPWWHWLIAMFVVLAAAMACSSVANEG
jgi:hypothetical protein